MTPAYKPVTEMTIDERIAHYESTGAIAAGCRLCDEAAYPVLRAGHDMPFMPRHTASSRCRSGHRPHCTCDTCF